MYHNTNNWQEFRGGYLKSKGGDSEVKNLISITPNRAYEIEGGGLFENFTPDP